MIWTFLIHDIIRESGQIKGNDYIIIVCWIRPLIGVYVTVVQYAFLILLWEDWEWDEWFPFSVYLKCMYCYNHSPFWAIRLGLCYTNTNMPPRDRLFEIGCDTSSLLCFYCLVLSFWIYKIVNSAPLYFRMGGDFLVRFSVLHKVSSPYETPI